MKKEGVVWWGRTVAFWAVRLFRGGHWQHA
jgi:hypothetical protein